MILLSHPTANQFSRSLLEGLYEKQLLESFHTCIHWDNQKTWNQWLPKQVQNELDRRSFPKAFQSFIFSYPRYEWGRLLSGKFKLDNLIQHEKGIFCLDRVYHHLDKKVSLYLSRKGQNISSIYAYEDGALESFLAAKKLNIHCIYDLPIAYWEFARKLYLEEAHRLPEWEGTLIGNKDSQKKCDRKARELDLADLVICPSQFVKDSIPNTVKKQKPVLVSPFGTPLINQKRISTKRRSGVVRFLFVGSMSQRKGLSDLFEAFNLLQRKDIELHVLGTPILEMEFYKNQFPHFVHHPTRPHKQVLDLMSQCDVFVLPSIVEGRAQVIQEAMSQSLPILITPNTGGEDLVDSQTGFLVPIRSPLEIAEKVNWFADNQSSIADMGTAARKKAKSVSWSRYQDNIIEAIQNIECC